MRIGIIGAGFIGGTLARAWARLGHEVTVANSRGPESLRELAREAGVRAAAVADAATGHDIVVISIPERAVPTLPASLFAGAADGLIVIDTNNYYPSRDGRIPEIDAGLLDSEWVARQLGRPVIKAFNNIVWSSLANKGGPRGTSGRLALSVAGDPAAARRTVLDLVDELGFDPVDAGGLADSWRQQPGTPCYCHDYDAARMRQSLAAADRASIATYREEADAAARPFFEPWPTAQLP